MTSVVFTYTAMLLLSYSSTSPLGGQQRFLVCACLFITGCQDCLCLFLFVLPQEGFTSQRYKIITTIIQSSHSQVFIPTNSSGRGQHAAPPMTGHTKCTITKLIEVLHNKAPDLLQLQRWAITNRICRIWRWRQWWWDITIHSCCIPG